MARVSVTGRVRGRVKVLGSPSVGTTASVSGTEVVTGVLGLG